MMTYWYIGSRFECPRPPQIFSGSTELKNVVLRDLEDVRTLQHNNEYLVKAIYHFFQSACMSPSFTLSDWFQLYHSGSIDDIWN